MMPGFHGKRINGYRDDMVAITDSVLSDWKIGAPIKGATLTGSGFETLKDIVMVGNDSMLDGGIGTCGKDGQSVPVGVGQPTMRIDRMTVGGQGR